MSKRQSSNGSRTVTERKNTMFTNKRWNTILGGFVVVVVILGITGVLTAAPESQEGTDYPNKVYLPIVSHDTGSVDNSTPTPVSEGIDTSNWKTYTDEVAGFSFKYPEDWRVAWGSSQGNSVTVLPNYGSRYRSISIDLDNIGNTVQSSSADVLNSMALQRVRDEHGAFGVDQMTARTVSVANTQAAELSHFPYVIGFHTQVVFTHGDYLYTITLEEGGHHEGIPDYEDPLAQQDLKLMYKILETLQFSQ